MKIGVAGISGRVGRLLAAAVTTAGAVLVGGTSRSGDGPEDVRIFPDIAALARASEMVIDFTHADAVAAHAEALVAAGVPWVLGTTGVTAGDQEAIAAAAGQIPVIASPNFSPGVNLLFAMAERMAAALPAAAYDAEILEMHHRQKVDAPSGTALALGAAVADGRDQVLEAVMVAGRSGHPGPRQDGEIGFAVLRGGQVTGSHSVLFTAAEEQIVLTHHAFDRRVYATGAVRAAFWLQGRQAGFYTMKDVLGL